MLIQSIDSIDECNMFLKLNSAYANGKNLRVEHLYATGADKSPRAYESLWGIYLSKPQFAWMALWMAVLSRTKLKKRQIKYIRPDYSRGDHIGCVQIFNPQELKPKEVLCEEAWLHLFNSKLLPPARIMDIEAAGDAGAKIESLIALGFTLQEVHKRNKIYQVYLAPTDERLLIHLDEWQTVLIGVETLSPNMIITLQPTLIYELRTRISFVATAISDDYLAPTS